jgi:hypothetical protein
MRRFPFDLFKHIVTLTCLFVNLWTLKQNYSFPWFVISAFLFSVESLVLIGQRIRLMSIILAVITLFIGLIRLSVFPPIIETILSFLLGICVGLAFLVSIEYAGRFRRQN